MRFYKSITNKPWETEGVIGGLEQEGTFTSPSQKVALILFLIIASVFFSLFTTTYILRMDVGDWVPLATPSMLWLNTALLVASSIILQRTRTAANAGETRQITGGFIIGGLCALGFIGGQLLVWQQLTEQGFYLTSNPATSFFYLMTGLHGIHLLGGLWVWSRTSIKLLSGAPVEDVRLSVELCTVYWHFLLVVWVLLFAMLANT